MKNLYKSNCMKGMLKPLATLFLFLALITVANAQVITTNGIKPPAVVSSVGAFSPGVFIGSNVVITDNGGSTCPNVTYEWQSASDANFMTNVKEKLASTKDYNPGAVTTTTYFRRVVTVVCTDPERSLESKTSGVKITIH